MSTLLPSLFPCLEQVGEAGPYLTQWPQGMLANIPEKSGVLVMCFSPNISMALATLLILIYLQFSSLKHKIELIIITGRLLAVKSRN